MGSPNGCASDTYWYFSNGAKAHGGSGGFAASDSFDEDYSASPDNWLISPAIELSGDSAVYTLQYFVSCDGFAGEHYELRLSTTDNLNTSFTEVLLSETLSNTSYEARVIDLSAYKGQTIYLAWHHCDCTDVMSLLLDTVTVIGAGGETPEPVPGDVNGAARLKQGMHSSFSAICSAWKLLRRNSLQRRISTAAVPLIRRMHCSSFALHSESAHKAARFKLLSAKAGETEQLTHS